MRSNVLLQYNQSVGQVAQLVERSPEKAGVGGSIPSLATTHVIDHLTRFLLLKESPKKAFCVQTASKSPSNQN